MRRRGQGRAWMTACIATAVCLCLFWFSPAVSAEADHDAPEQKNRKPKRKLAVKTLGGRQFWGDVAFFHDWRIQRNVFTGRYRLLDGNDFRHAAGTLDDCRKELDEIKKTRKLAPMSGKAVILVHGIIRSSKSFDKMRARLKKEGYQVFGFDYPSTQVSIPESAGYLAGVIESLEGIEEINFVAHSMGGLVIRSYLSSHRDKRIKRMVMLGVPNNGAHMADRMKQVLLYRAVLGPAGQQLVSDPAGFIKKLPTPDFEFAVLAGGRGNLTGYNPLVPGDDDGTLSVSSTRLPGAADFAVVACLHSFLVAHDKSIDYTVRFLKTGHLREKGDSRPIPRMNTRKGPTPRNREQGRRPRRNDRD